MKRRDFMKQAAAIATGAVVGAKLPAVISPTPPGVMGVDLARGKDLSFATAAWQGDGQGHPMRLESIAVPRLPEGFWEFYTRNIALTLGLSPNELYGLPVRESVELAWQGVAS